MTKKMGTSQGVEGALLFSPGCMGLREPKCSNSSLREFGEGHFRHCRFVGFRSASAVARSVDGEKGANYRLMLCSKMNLLDHLVGAQKVVPLTQRSSVRKHT